MSYTPTLDLGLGNIESTVVTTLDNAEEAVKAALVTATSDGDLSTGEALELQYELAKWALLYESASNVGKKIDDGISNTVANMR